MKRLLFIPVFLLLTIVNTFSVVYTPGLVPNPKLQGQNYYVSNPEQILLQETVDSINDLCVRLYDSTRVEMAVVAISDIGEAEPFDFGYNLFELWGIGGKERNTGLLITFILDSHNIYINTGTGIEGIMTDAICRKVIDLQMLPSFRKEQYDEGLLNGVKAICDICTSDEAPEELLAAKYTPKESKDEEDEHIFRTIMKMLLLVVAFTSAVFIPFLIAILFQGKKQTYTKELEQRDHFVIALVACCIFWPFAIPAIVWFCKRRKRLRCPQCGKHQMIKTGEEVVRESTTKKKGLKHVKFVCQSCGHEHIEEVELPYASTGGDYYYSSSSGDSGSSHHGWGGGGSSSGSWGGGHSSGGGAGASW